MNTQTQYAHPLAQYEGRVVFFRESNGYHDSDFSALVEKEPGVFGWVEYATTRYHCPWGYSAPLNATDDVLDRYDEAVARDRASTQELLSARESMKAHKGSTVRVVAGRKHRGFEGTVFWRGEDQFRSSRWGTFFRLGIERDGVKAFVPADQCEVLVDGEWVAVRGYESNDSILEHALALSSLPDSFSVRQAVVAWRERNK